jgi:ureidoacrylate peracid hydrolase
MHKVAISPIVVDRSRRARRRAHPYQSVIPAKTAHLIVDLQNGFMEEGAPIEVPVARSIVPNVNAICLAVRNAGGLNVFLRFVFDPEEPNKWDNYLHGLLDADSLNLLRAGFSRGTHHWQLWP